MAYLKYLFFIPKTFLKKKLIKDLLLTSSSKCLDIGRTGLEGQWGEERKEGVGTSTGRGFGMGGAWGATIAQDRARWWGSYSWRFCQVPEERGLLSVDHLFLFFNSLVP